MDEPRGFFFDDPRGVPHPLIVLALGARYFAFHCLSSLLALFLFRAPTRSFKFDQSTKALSLQSLSLLPHPASSCSNRTWFTTSCSVFLGKLRLGTSHTIKLSVASSSSSSSTTISSGLSANCTFSNSFPPPPRESDPHPHPHISTGGLLAPQPDEVVVVVVCEAKVVLFVVVVVLCV